MQESGLWIISLGLALGSSINTQRAAENFFERFSQILESIWTKTDVIIFLELQLVKHPPKLKKEKNSI